ncbi:MAG TPA: hypothetical protein VFY81_03190 [Gammaproteobacteria bacterium]|nr:hypothetical protein [Gammaproteobacteria bacterium]
MDIEPNPEALHHLARGRRETSRGRPAWQWVLIIAAGVLLANGLTALATRAYLMWELQQLSVALDEQSRQWRLQNEAAQREARAERVKREAELQRQMVEQRRAQQRQAAVQQQLRETCDYWQRQVMQQNSDYNRSMRDSACSQR